MYGRKCSSSLCPFSFGLAVGLTVALTVFFCSWWSMYYGAMPFMESMHMAVPATLGGAGIYALWGLLKGFVFGFFVALFYSLIRGCCKKCCCKCCKCDEKACEAEKK